MSHSVAAQGGRQRGKCRQREIQTRQTDNNASSQCDSQCRETDKDRSKRRQKYRETDRDRPTRRLNNTALSGLCGWRDTEHPQGKMHMHSICRKRTLIQHTLRPCLDLPRARPSTTNGVLQIHGHPIRLKHAFFSFVFMSH